MPAGRNCSDSAPCEGLRNKVGNTQKNRNQNRLVGEQGGFLMVARRAAQVVRTLLKGERFNSIWQQERTKQ